MSADKVSPSNERNDIRMTSSLLIALKKQMLVDFTNDGYHITDTGKFRLQQLKERQEYESQTTSHLNDLNKKLDQERADRIAAEEQAAKEAQNRNRIENIRFILNTIVGIVSAVAAVIGAIFAALAFFS